MIPHKSCIRFALLLAVALSAAASAQTAPVRTPVPNPIPGKTPAANPNAHPHQEPCWQVAGISKATMDQRRSLQESARSQVAAVCADSSLTAQQRQEKIRQIHQQTQQELNGLINPQQMEAMKTCQQSRSHANPHPGGGGHPAGGGGHGPCGELPAPGAGKSPAPSGGTQSPEIDN
jgi:hypothetical protein